MRGNDYRQYNVKFVRSPWGEVTTVHEYNNYENNMMQIHDYYAALAVADKLNNSGKYKYNEERTTDWEIDISQGYFCMNLEASLPKPLQIALITNLEFDYSLLRSMNAQSLNLKVDNFKQILINAINGYVKNQSLNLYLRDMYINQREHFSTLRIELSVMVVFDCNNNIIKDEIIEFEKTHSNVIMDNFIDNFKKMMNG